MRAGEFKDGACVLRAKIDMAAPNIVMRDPTIYRIKHVDHYRTGQAWCIYPMYDFTHCLSDAVEGVTHSICTLEFENNRELYDWVLDTLKTPCHPQQIEFARLNLNYTVLSKRKLIELVEKGFVSGWDDPRMPTISGYRRRGYTPEAIRNFCERIGVSKAASTVDIGLMEYCLRDDLNKRTPRVMAVLRPLKVGRWRSLRRSTTRRTRAWARGRCPSAARSTSSARTSWRTRPRSFSGWRRAARCACATPTSSPVSKP